MCIPPLIYFISFQLSKFAKHQKNCYRIILFTLIIVFPRFGFAQLFKDFHQEKDFIKYLIDTKTYDEAEFVLNHLNNSNDSVIYFKGVVNFYQKKLYTSSHEFLLISKDNYGLWINGRLITSFNHLYLGNNDSAAIFLPRGRLVDDNLEQLRLLQKSAIFLLEDKVDSFNEVSNNFTFQQYSLANGEKKIIELADEWKNMRKPSPILAGIFSSLIPGTGKIYAGKMGEGLGTILFSSLLGLQVWEAYRVGGTESPYLYIFGSLFTLYYAGNIYGSVITTQRIIDDKKNSIRERVLFNVHVPLRNLLDL